MSYELPLSPSSRHWLNLVAGSAALHPSHPGERWFLHLTPNAPHAKTTTMQVRWLDTHWQLLSISNAGDWPNMHDPIDELCFDSERRRFWVCQGGPVTAQAQSRVLTRFLTDLQRTCTHHGFTVESDPLHQEEPQDAQATNNR